MSTIGLVAPEHRDLVPGFAGLFDPDSTDAVAAFRANLVAGATSLVTPNPTPFEVVAIPADADRPALRVLLHKPKAPKGLSLAIIYLHGGGLLAGTPDMMAGASDTVASETGSLVIAPDYRLAPEHRFPAALEDAFATLAWLHANASDLGVDPARISVMGDSAGGLLAAGLTLLAQDRGLPPLRAQFLLYPMLDNRTAGPDALSDDPLTGEFVWTRKQTLAAWRLSAGEAPLDEQARGYHSPSLRADLKGLPPAYVMLAGLDLLRDEGLAYAQRLMAAGVPVDLVVHAGAVHAFDILPGPVSERARAQLLDAIRRLG